VAAEGGRAGVTRHQCSIDDFQDAVQIGIHIAIPKAKYAKAGTFQCYVTFFVSIRMSFQIVLTAVNLDNKPLLQTDEVDNVSLPWRLAAKMKSALSP
jgi:hypothetical protein